MIKLILIITFLFITIWSSIVIIERTIYKNSVSGALMTLCAIGVTGLIVFLVIL